MIDAKAPGNPHKIGKQCRYLVWLEKIEAPSGPGLSLMDNRSVAAEAVSLQSVAGFIALFFPTGQGNVIDNPVNR